MLTVANVNAQTLVLQCDTENHQSTGSIIRHTITLDLDTDSDFGYLNGEVEVSVKWAPNRVVIKGPAPKDSYEIQTVYFIDRVTLELKTPYEHVVASSPCRILKTKIENKF